MLGHQRSLQELALTSQRANVDLAAVTLFWHRILCFWPPAVDYNLQFENIVKCASIPPFAVRDPMMAGLRCRYLLPE